MIRVSDLRNARAEIASRIANHCAHGPQSRGLPPEVKACGQYLGPTDGGSGQRGVHGTAAALRVLGSTEGSDARDLVPQLVRYLGDRLTIEKALRSEPDFLYFSRRLASEDHNVIKLSETLYALSFVPPAVCSTEELVQRIAQQLLAGLQGDSGWTYFLDQPGEAQVLPTAHAVRALARTGYDVAKPARWLLKRLSQTSGPSGAGHRADLSVRVYCLFVLAFSGIEHPPETRELKGLFKELWRKLEPLMADDVEQNVEYGRGDERYFVRVPWQLYLIPLAAKLSTLYRFASLGVQGRLAAILRSVGSPEGFIYPDSGYNCSARTNAILFDSLALIEDHVSRHPWKVVPGMIWDGLRAVAGSRLATFGGISTAVVFAAVSVRQWIAVSGRLSDLAPEILVSAVVILLSARKPR
jgi:hypothetical protein